jgi:hypothetical protein
MPLSESQRQRWFVRSAAGVGILVGCAQILLVSLVLFRSIHIAAGLGAFAFCVGGLVIWQHRSYRNAPFARWRRGECAACGYPRPVLLQSGDRCSECGETLDPPQRSPE